MHFLGSENQGGGGGEFGVLRTGRPKMKLQTPIIGLPACMFSTFLMIFIFACIFEDFHFLMILKYYLPVTVQY